MTTTDSIATETQIQALRLCAVNDTTREIMAHGVTLSHEQADDLGEEVLAWIGGRLCLNVRTTDDGVECTPPKHYASEEDRRAGLDYESDTCALTDAQIRSLRSEAAQAGDCDQIALCDLALDGEIDMDEVTGVTPALARRLRSMSQDEARSMCAAAIASAEAQS